MNSENGKLYIVSTPIGNLKDITFRAIEVLKQVGLIAAEDTRRTRELLNYFNIDTNITSYHEHNRFDKAKEIIARLKEGTDVALVTDAGTPIISDPGDALLAMSIDEGIEVIAVPGCCAAINALVLSGLDARSFVFVGFIQDDNKKRKEQFELLKNETRTMIFYISPHDILMDLKYLIDVFGENRKASLSREMTKVHEETIRGGLKYLLDNFSDREIKGEFVLVVSGLDKKIAKNMETEKWMTISIEDHYQKYIDEGFDDKDAIKKVAQDRDVEKREIYKKLKVK